jgi:hypothetical protein
MHISSKIKLGAACVAVLAVALAFSPAQAHRWRPLRVSANLSGYSEVPAVSTNGSGYVELEVARDGSKINFELYYADLEGSVTAAHVHFGAKATNGGVSFFFCGGGGKPACPPAPAFIKGTIVAADILGPAAQGIAAGELDEVIAAIRNDVTYANVHSTLFPGGEIRGELR